MKSTVVLKNNNLILNEEIKEYLKSIKDSTLLEIELSIKGKKRTKSQNSKYWKLCGIVADQTGYSSNQIHDLFREKFLGEEELDFGNGLIQKQLKHTPDSTTSEFSDYYTLCEVFSIEFFDIKL